MAAYNLKTLADNTFIFPLLNLAVKKEYFIAHYEEFCIKYSNKLLENSVIYYKYSDDNYIDWNAALRFNTAFFTLEELLAESEYLSNLKVPITTINALPKLKYIDEDGYNEDILYGNGTLTGYSFLNRYTNIQFEKKAYMNQYGQRVLQITLPFEAENFLISFNNLLEPFTVHATMTNIIYFDLDYIFESEEATTRYDLGINAELSIVGFYNLKFNVLQPVIDVEDGWFTLPEMYNTDILVFNKLIYDFEINPNDNRRVRIIGLDGDSLAEIEKNLDGEDIIEAGQLIKIYRPVPKNSNIKSLEKITFEALNPSDSQIMTFPFNIYNAILVYEGISVRGIQLNTNTVSYATFAPDFIDINKQELGKLQEDGWVKMILYIYKS